MNCSECAAALPPEARFCLQCGTRVPAAPDPAGDPLRDTLERAIGFQYRIERLLGRGGMGAVYLAHEFALDRDVAIKVLPPEHAGTAQMRARFKQEGRTAARLTHPNIVPLHTFGEVDGLMYFVMGYVSGDSLAARLSRDRTMSSDTTRALLADLTGALEYAHRQGIVHRDLKPDNILLDADSGAPLLTDFGIAKAPAAGGQLTMTGQIIGTAHYMSPEQARGQADVDARSDLYSLGVMAYEMIAGRRPFEADNPLDALTQRLTQDPPPLRAVVPDVDDDLSAAIMRCLQREPANRWPDARTLRAAIAPADDADDPLPIRLLKLWVVFAVVGPIASVYLGIFRGPAAAIGSSIGLLGPLLILSAGTFLVARRQTFTAGAIVRLVFAQPRGWRFWYPKRFRRRGDVWDRLPPRVRRLRVQSTVVFGLLIGIAIPIQIGIFATGRMSAVRIPLAVFIVACAAFGALARVRMTKYVSSTLRVPAAEASRILSLKSWQTAAWQSGPASDLLRLHATAPDASRLPSDSAPTVRLSSKAGGTNEVTHV